MSYEETLAFQINSCLQKPIFKEYKKIGECVDIALSILQSEEQTFNDTEDINGRMMGLFIETESHKQD